MKLKKFRGQHLLTDSNMIGRIVRESKISSEDHVIEIGAGTGILTDKLADASKKVLSFEIDRDMEEYLDEIRQKHSNLEIRIENFLDFELGGFLKESESVWRVIANIPYNITTPIIEKIVDEGYGRLASVNLLMQKEVARRITASPGTKDYGKLSIFAEFFFESRILFVVPPDVFVPPPQVDSAFIEMIPKKETLSINPALFFRIVHVAFEQRRKQIRNPLRSGFKKLDPEKLEKALALGGIDPRRRAETLSLDEFANLTRGFEKVGQMEGIKLV